MTGKGIKLMEFEYTLKTTGRTINGKPEQIAVCYNESCECKNNCLLYMVHIPAESSDRKYFDDYSRCRMAKIVSNEQFADIDKLWLEWDIPEKYKVD